MRAIGRLTTGLTVALALASSLAWAEDSLTRRDTRGPVAVTATLLPAEPPGGVTKVRIALNTHSVGLDAIALDRAIALRNADGTDVAPTAVETSGSGHHRSAVLSFPDPTGDAAVRVVVKDVGGVPERVFTWDRPAAR